jgi:UDP-N-acetyl-D-mannosaminuronic acid transferase (WecB/TagA/CpsF family)
LPTPKQEIFAHFLSSKNKNFKIICIGGSIAIASGEEKVVPEYISYLEFLWRLRYETFRRVKRLLTTFCYYCYGSIFTKKLKELKIEYI